MVTDMHGNPLQRGDVVRVHTDETQYLAVVHETFPDNPTASQPGHWVDIDCGRGVSGMMSFALELTKYTVKEECMQ